MPTPQTDLRALRRGPRATEHTSASSLDPLGTSAVVPRPKARWATRLLVPAAVLLATGCLLAYAARDTLQPRLEVYVAAAIPKQSAVVPVNTANAAALEPVEDHAANAPLGPVAVQAPGWIEPAPYAVSVPALAEGVVKEVRVLEGEHIEAGQVIARLIDDDAKLTLRAAEAAISERTADVDRAKAVLATARSKVAVEQSAVDELRDEVTRKRALVDTGGVAAGDFRRLEIRLSGLEAAVVAAENLVLEAQAALAQAESTRNTALVVRDEAALRLLRMEVRSPVAGTVLARLVEPGSRISTTSDVSAAGGPMGVVLRVYDPAHLQVRVDVPLADAAKVGVGTRATVSTEALPDQTFSGVVSRVVHEANIQRNTVQFKVALDAPSPVLKPEMLTRVKLHAPASATRQGRGGVTGSSGSPDGDSGDMTLLVPSTAVTLQGDDKGQVWIVDTSGGSPVARRRDIATAPSADEGFIAVTSGLRLTHRVILDPPPPPAIKDGTRLKVLGERASTASSETPTTP